jgi:hypothetical protein
MIDRPYDPAGAFDDDRLFAFALGLDDDPELAAAADAQPELARRIDQMRAEIGAVTRRLQAAVPTAPDDYSEPSAERWPRLHEFFDTTQGAARRRGRRGRSRGRLAAALAAAALLALAVGIGTVDLFSGATDSQVATTSDDARSEAVGAPPADKGMFGSVTGGGPIVLPEARHFKEVVVARAGEMFDGLQRFEVIRTLKGRIVERVALLVRDGARALPLGSLEILYMRPLHDYVMAGAWDGPDAYGADGGEATGSEPSPITSPAPLGVEAPTGDAVMPTPAAGYSVGSAQAYVQAVPQGVDVALLSAP